MTSTPAHFRPLTRDQRFRPFGPGLQVATGTAHFLGIPLWNTTAAIELDRPGELMLWNPIALTPALGASLRDLERTSGRRVTVLLAPFDYHHRALPGWQASFPEAVTYLVSERITEQQTGVRGQVLAGDRPELPGGESVLELLSVRGCRQPIVERSPRWKDGPRREWFLLHRPSRTLLIGDMLFSHAELSWAERWLLRWRVGFNYNQPGFRVGNRAERDGFLREVLARDFDQALTVHGRASAHGGDDIRADLRTLFRL